MVEGRASETERVWVLLHSQGPISSAPTNAEIELERSGSSDSQVTRHIQPDITKMCDIIGCLSKISLLVLCPVKLGKC